MKIIPILIIFFLIKSNLSINYDLINNKEENILSLKSDEIYTFYIEANDSQIANISLVMNYMNTIPFNYLNIHEYSSRSSRSALKTTSKHLIASSKNNQLLSTFTYAVNNSATKYIALSLEPTYNISSLTVKVGVEENTYDLSEGVSKTLTNLKNKTPYYFYISSTQYKTNCISIDMSYEYFPFTNFSIFEYSERSSLIHLKNTTILSDSYIKDKKFLYDYTVKFKDTKYIALKIVPDNNINIFIIKIDIKGDIYDLSNGIPKNITNLFSGIQYFFSIPSSQFQTNCINLTTNYMESIHFSNFYIYEINNSISSTYIKKKTLFPSFSFNNNQLILSFIYFVSNNSTKFIHFKIIPNYNINYLIIQTNVEGGGYELTNSFPKTITNLKFGIPYYFYIPSTQFQIENIILTMNYINTKPFSYINIYEYEEISSLKSTKILSQIFTTSNIDNKLMLWSNYSISSYSTKYFCLEIIPKYNISYLVAQIDVDSVTYDLSNDVPKNLTNLKAGIPYYFYIQSTQFQIDFINLIMNFMDRIPLTNLYIYEILNKSSLNYIKNISQTITTSNINNQLITFSNYSVNNYLTKYIAVKIIPNYNIDYLIIKIDVEGGSYDLSNGVLEKITNLKSGFIYYFFIPSFELQTIFINITMNLMDTLPFTFLDIFEYQSREPSNYLKNISQAFTTLTKNNQFLSSFKYLVSNYKIFCFKNNTNL